MKKALWLTRHQRKYLWKILCYFVAHAEHRVTSHINNEEDRICMNIALSEIVELRDKVAKLERVSPPKRDLKRAESVDGNSDEQ